MRERLVGVKGSRSLWMMRVRRGLRPPPWGAGLGVDDHAASQKVIRNQRRQPEQRRRGKASRVRNASCRLDCLAICLSKSVNKLRLRVHRRLLATIVLCEHLRVAQTKVTRKVNDFHVRRKSRRNFHRLSVRQGKEDAVWIVQAFETLGSFNKPQVSKAEKILVHLAHGFAGVFIRGDKLNLSVRMLQQNAQ